MDPRDEACRDFPSVWFFFELSPEITGQGPGLVNVQLTAISSQYTRQLTLTEGELDKFFGNFTVCVLVECM